MSADQWLDIAVAGLFVIVCLLFLIAVFMSIFHSGDGTYISYDGDPDPNCPDCHGTGIIHKGDPHFECDCPCKMEFL